MSDKKIPGSVFIIVGAAMVLMSVFIDITKLALFILAGAVFIVVGFIKIMMQLEEDRKHAHHASKLKHSQAVQHHAPQHPHSAQHAQHQQHVAQQKKDYENKTQTTQVVHCSQCGVKLHHLFKFCPNCGQKLK